jgi:hypothetical protein
MDDVKDAWRPIFTPTLLGQIWSMGCKKALGRQPWTLVAVVKKTGDIFVSRYNANPQSSEDPIEKKVQGTKSYPIKPPIRIFLFDDLNSQTAQGDLDADGHWATY